jgi:hypoxanthine phosphoribosyltransferase
MTIPSHPTYDQIHAACGELYHKITDKDLTFDCVVGLARGGLLPAVILSHMLKIPMVSAHYSSKAGKGDNRDHPNDLPIIKNKKILLIDDICDSANTLTETIVYFRVLECDVTSAVLFCKEDKCTVPDYYVWKIPRDFEWIVFPFEQTHGCFAHHQL